MPLRCSISLYRSTQRRIRYYYIFFSPVLSILLYFVQLFSFQSSPFPVIKCFCTFSHSFLFRLGSCGECRSTEEKKITRKNIKNRRISGGWVVVYNMYSGVLSNHGNTATHNAHSAYGLRKRKQWFLRYCKHQQLEKQRCEKIEEKTEHVNGHTKGNTKEVMRACSSSKEMLICTQDNRPSCFECWNTTVGSGHTKQRKNPSASNKITVESFYFGMCSISMAPVAACTILKRIYGWHMYFLWISFWAAVDVETNGNFSFVSTTTTTSFRVSAIFFAFVGDSLRML